MNARTLLTHCDLNNVGSIKMSAIKPTHIRERILEKCKESMMIEDEETFSLRDACTLYYQQLYELSDAPCFYCDQELEYVNPALQSSETFYAIWNFYDYIVSHPDVLFDYKDSFIAGGTRDLRTFLIVKPKYRVAGLPSFFILPSRFRHIVIIFPNLCRLNRHQLLPPESSFFIYNQFWVRPALSIGANQDEIHVGENAEASIATEFRFKLVAQIGGLIV